MRISGIDDVVKWRLCVGCGACAYFSDGALKMADDARQGHRPVWNGPRDEILMKDCLKVCPVVGTDSHHGGRTRENATAYDAGIGPVLEVWEGHALDPETRHLASSGGVLTALANHALDRAGMQGVLQVRADPENPLRNRTVMSRTKDELLASTGSRYAPASACDGLRMIENSSGPCVFIGQPSEVAALRKAQAVRPALNQKVGLALSFFCAGSPSTQGTLDLLASRGIDPGQVGILRYRGRGWPGTFAVWLKDAAEPVLEMSYAESWAFVQAYRPWAVQLWPDGLGELADISCGDPWYRAVNAGEPGSSLVVVRTETGRRFVREAMAAGYLELTRVDVGKVLVSQRNLMRKKGAVWGRLMTMRLMGLPAPDHRGDNLFRSWLKLPVRDKMRSTLGTARRILTRNYHRPDPLAMTPAVPVGQNRQCLT